MRQLSTSTAQPRLRSSKALLSRAPAQLKKASQPAEMQAIHVFKTELGWMAICGTQRGLTTLTFGHGLRQEAIDRIKFESQGHHFSPPSAPGSRSRRGDSLEFSWMEQAESLLIAYAAGEPVDLSTIPQDIPAGTRFEQRVREQLSRIGYGQTITYGQLADAAEAPRAARAVGSVMSRNTIPLVVACHRVIAASGKLAGYSTPAGLDMKKRLLEMERSGRPVTGSH